MTATTFADAKARFFELVASAEATHERTTITRNGRAVAVIVSVEDLESLEETVAVMYDPDLREAVRIRANESIEATPRAELSRVLMTRPA